MHVLDFDLLMADIAKPGTITYSEGVMGQGKSHIYVCMMHHYVTKLGWVPLHNFPTCRYLMPGEDAPSLKGGRLKTKEWAELPGTRRAESLLDVVREAAENMIVDTDRPTPCFIDEFESAFSYFDSDFGMRQGFAKFLPLIRKLNLSLFLSSPNQLHAQKVVRDYSEIFIDKDYAGPAAYRRAGADLDHRQVCRIQTNPTWAGGDLSKHRYPRPIYLAVGECPWAKPHYEPGDLGYMHKLPAYFGLGEYAPGVPFDDFYMLPTILKDRRATDEETPEAVLDFIERRIAEALELSGPDGPEAVEARRRSAADLAVEVLELLEERGTKTITLAPKFVEVDGKKVKGSKAQITLTKQALCELLGASRDTVNSRFWKKSDKIVESTCQNDSAEGGL